MKRNKIFAIAATMLLSVGLGSCLHDDNAVWHIWKMTIQAEGLKGGAVSVPVGETLQLTLDIVPDFVNVIDPVWESADEKIATVSSTGLVTGVMSGTTVITVFSKNNPEIRDKVTVKVEGGAISVSTTAIDQSDAD
jgi:hypothetical protein